MPPLITGLSKDEVRWSKFKNSYMYNDTYYLRRTKFIIYQCATTSMGICSGIAGPTIHQYRITRDDTTTQFPNVQVDVNDLIAVLAVQIAAAAIIGMVFTPALFYDLFWPERWEAPIIQTLWKWGAITSSIVQLGAAIAVTVVMATGNVSIRADNLKDWTGARSLWINSTYDYLDPLVIVTVVFSWIGLVFTAWSTVVMWMCYRHNNKYGPFNSHIKKHVEENGVITEESDLTMTA